MALVDSRRAADVFEDSSSGEAVSMSASIDRSGGDYSVDGSLDDALDRFCSAGTRICRVRRDVICCDKISGYDEPRASRSVNSHCSNPIECRRERPS
jgi:hypothetical protein